MAERAAGGFAHLKERRPVELEDLHRTLAGYLLARYFKAQRTGGFEQTEFAEAELARARAWQAYLEDAEGGQGLPRSLRDLKVLAELAASASVFLDALDASPHVERDAAADLRRAVDNDHPASLPGLLAKLAAAIRDLP
jgi:hypothetical protein